jgi:NTP pyrophosphatase (non-canonical NTP hydrolase)
MERLFAIGADRWAGLSKLIEEAGEVVQVCGKLLATYGDVKHWEGSHLGERLEQELGDLLAAVEFVLEVNPAVLSRQAVEARLQKKLELFRQWHRGR